MSVKVAGRFAGLGCRTRPSPQEKPRVTSHLMLPAEELFSF